LTKPVTRWWWIRHGPVVGHDAICIGQLDLAADLSDGPALARLSETLPVAPSWVTSPLGRARNTLEAIRAHRGDDNTDPVVEPGFAEQHFGVWQGLTYDAVRVETGDDAWRTPSKIQPPGGESFDTVVARVAGALDRVGATFSGSEIVVVAHAGSIRAALAKTLDLAPDRALAISIDHLSVTAFAHHGDGAWSVEFVNRLP
jgi:alpha-ribazole phosphatase